MSKIELSMPGAARSMAETDGSVSRARAPSPSPKEALDPPYDGAEDYWKGISRTADKDVPAIGDLVLRNLVVTQTYHDLSAALTLILGSNNLNWCTFAIWASEAAGRRIRWADCRLIAVLDLLSKVLERLRIQGPGGKDNLAKRWWHSLDSAAVHVSKGNTLVFKELAPVFTAFIDFLKVDPAPDVEAFERFLETTLRSGPTEKDGQDELKDALRLYRAAASQPDCDKKAWLIVEGNLKIGFHEQTRLDPHIDAALAAPVYIVFGALRDEHGRAWFEKSRGPHARLAAALFKQVSRWMRRGATKTLLWLKTPAEGRLLLGRWVKGDGALNERLSDPTFLEPYQQTYERLHFGPNDWSELHERMSYIGRLFWYRRQQRDYFRQPFKDDDRARIGKGEWPARFKRPARRSLPLGFSAQPPPS